MANRPITNCGDCAYVIKENGRMWCPFHDVAVSKNRVCDDFLDEYDSPQWKSLSAGKSKRSFPQHTGKDILFYVLTGIMILCGILFYFV